jgi:hypothetical protein
MYSVVFSFLKWCFICTTSELKLQGTQVGDSVWYSANFLHSLPVIIREVNLSPGIFPIQYNCI